MNARTDVIRLAVPRRRAVNSELWLGAAMLIALILFALTSVLPSSDPDAYSSTPFATPSLAHWLGTDNLGRDVATRMAVATGNGLLLSLVATALSAAIGTTLALVAGYLGGVWDALIMRTLDLVLSIPGLLMALMIKVILGPGIGTLMLTLVIIFAPVFARIMRGPVLSVRERGFVRAAEVVGRNRAAIAWNHLLPNILTPLFITAAGIAGEAVLVEATLSYLGQGLQPPTPSAGRMINEFQKFMTLQPLLVVIPALFIFFQVAAWNLLADGLQKALATTRGARRPRRTIWTSSRLTARRATAGESALNPASTHPSERNPLA